MARTSSTMLSTSGKSGLLVVFLILKDRREYLYLILFPTSLMAEHLEFFVCLFLNAEAGGLSGNGGGGPGKGRKLMGQGLEPQWKNCRDMGSQL